MPDTSRTSHGHRSRIHSHRSSPENKNRSGYLDPVFYFSGAILLLICAKILHASLLSPAIGSLGIIILAISKIWRSKTGILISMVCILAMAVLYAWQWVDRYVGAVVSAEITGNSFAFISVLSEGFILALIAWGYHRMLNSILLRMGQKWFVKKSYVIIFKLLFYVQTFLALFWMIAFILQKAQPFTRLGIQDSAMIAGALALLASGIPALIYLSKSSPGEKRQHRHVHHHRHDRDGQLKNPGVD
jgi:hypothetical protein